MPIVIPKGRFLMSLMKWDQSALSVQFPGCPTLWRPSCRISSPGDWNETCWGKKMHTVEKVINWSYLGLTIYISSPGLPLECLHKHLDALCWEKTPQTSEIFPYKLTHAGTPLAARWNSGICLPIGRFLSATCPHWPRVLARCLEHYHGTLYLPFE